MMSMLKKIVLFPISLFVAFLALMARWLLTLSSYVVAPLMLYIFGCGIYTVYRQTWNQFFILLVAEFICFMGYLICHHSGSLPCRYVGIPTAVVSGLTLNMAFSIYLPYRFSAIYFSAMWTATAPSATAVTT